MRLAELFAVARDAELEGDDASRDAVLEQAGAAAAVYRVAYPQPLLGNGYSHVRVYEGNLVITFDAGGSPVASEFATLGMLTRAEMHRRQKALLIQTIKALAALAAGAKKRQRSRHRFGAKRR